ncbi:MAG: Ig-like domain-containing protein [Kofleriaceae bacterium]|nr:Ig-like domain-containing protein [Kofleriaceae bacterium]
MAGAALVVCATCGDPVEPLATAEHGVIFTYPVDGQLDVPVGARVVIAFSDRVDASALDAYTLVGPEGPVAATPVVSSDGRTVSFEAPPLAPGATYAVNVGSALSPSAKNLPASGPLFSFTTRSSRPRAAPPSLIAVNGGPPTMPTQFRPMFETSTIRLVFSEPLDPRTVAIGANAIELRDMTTGTPVPVTVLSNGIHVAIDPTTDLAPGRAYQLRLGSQLLDLSGQALAPAAILLTPENSRGANPIQQVLRTRLAGDPGPESSRSGMTPNVIAIDKPLIGREEAKLLASTVAAELGDPQALGGPIAFRIPRGQRLHASGLDVKLGGQIPVGLSTGTIEIELLTDGGGRIYRNRYQPASQVPENARSPLHVDLSLDVAVYAVDPTGNAVLTQTVLGVQATGTVIATDGVLAIESLASMELALLGVTSAPSNLVLELITDPQALVETDATPPTLLSSAPSTGTSEHPVDAGIELIFDEPVNLDRLRAGGLQLQNSANAVVPSVIESHGAAVVVRPLAPLAYSSLYTVVLSDVADAAGNKAAATTVGFTTPTLVTTSVPMTVVAMYPGAPCTLVEGRCVGGPDSDDVYHPFLLPANEAIDVVFSSPLRRNTAVRGAACGQGSVRIEEVDASGNCIAPVAGSLMVRDRGLGFVPDEPWEVGKEYKVTLISGGNNGCDTGELCGTNNVAASFDPLNGTESGGGGGANLVVRFTGAPRAASTFLLATAAPFSDVNGSGFREASELERDENRAAMRTSGSSGAVSDPSFNGPDCVPSTPEHDACMYLQGAMPVAMGEVENDCPLPDGTRAPMCLPVTISAQVMYATSLSLDAEIINVATITSDTGTAIMRVREPTSGPVKAYLIDKGGVATLVGALDLYMDAPDMSLPLSDHDLHSKPLSIGLEGPLTFLPDGRIALSLSNTADVEVEVNIDAPLGIEGSVKMLLPRGEMKLQLLSPLLRGGTP